MNEGVPVRTIGLMILTTVVVAGITVFLMMHFFTPTQYVF